MEKRSINEQAYNEWKNAGMPFLPIPSRLLRDSGMSAEERLAYAWYLANPGTHKTGDVAESLGMPAEWVAEAFAQLVKDDYIAHEDGRPLECFDNVRCYVLPTFVLADEELEPIDKLLYAHYITSKIFGDPLVGTDEYVEALAFDADSFDDEVKDALEKFGNTLLPNGSSLLDPEEDWMKNINIQ